ncbi:MAG: esterase [Acidobacteria bacterium]|nr:esterase [Acidobacteriota bacterium]
MCVRSMWIVILLAGIGAAQDRPAPPPPVVSPEVQADRKVTFRIVAPKAQAVALSAGDILNLPKGGLQFTKGANGVWEATTEPVNPGAYRYRFVVDGVPVVDPRNALISESNTNVWSMVNVPGAEWMDAGKVPHGAVAEIPYLSSALGRYRRMHIYTPPGYELGKGKYPVFYLLHGAGDNDDAWTSVGRAGYILDNLIAAGKAKPMVIVMPAGHTSTAGGISGMDDYTKDFTQDVMPYVEKHYRVLKDRKSRAIAGLSMGGMQTLNISMSHLDQFAYIGVYSSGVFGMRRPAAPGAAAPAPAVPPEWEQQRLAMLDNPKLKPGLKLLWFATGKDDFLLGSTKATIAMLEKHGFKPVYEETTGGHTWVNWRIYLNEFAPKLFR